MTRNPLNLKPGEHVLAVVLPSWVWGGTVVSVDEDYLTLADAAWIERLAKPELCAFDARNTLAAIDTAWHVPEIAIALDQISIVLRAKHSFRSYSPEAKALKQV